MRPRRSGWAKRQTKRRRYLHLLRHGGYRMGARDAHRARYAAWDVVSLASPWVTG